MGNLDDRLPSIPDYYKLYVDPHVDLEQQSSQPCPFHNEKSGKSFSYSKQLGNWRCFGQCHCGGDVIDLHRLNYGLRNREEAKASLYKLYNISMVEVISFVRERPEVNEDDVYRRRVYALALDISKRGGPDQWLDLDYILSKEPFDLKELELFCAKNGRPVFSDRIPAVN